ncbi:MAG: hypothetical protein WCB19_06890 [Thermoplasmata archaeon]
MAPPSIAGENFEILLADTLEKAIPLSLYRVAWRERLRYSGRMDPVSGNRENPHTDYQVDLVVVRGVEFQPGDTAEEVPLVAIEAKTQSTTDNILAASKKAEALRTVYPWIRIGYVVNAPYLTAKSLWHGRTFDFLLCVKNLSRSQLQERLGERVLKELETAEMGIEVLGGSHRKHREYPALPNRSLEKRVRRIRPSGLRD